ncbi:arginine N-succinyltransferase [Parachitinimonas caeni]|uniref:Arginine N-succinyltransferase n=1 Tax=Parachitinimonas caeni TaxID=3031301 RepID=A0ABT7E2Y4_9NEIS|nr:arginine N-succinyltransferase [Parachitinimonas caeni]MDK2126665.1 arginine N-succinyltransferase [Parachitinimonas caeni]
MLLFRPSRFSDLPAVERIAALSPIGVTSLPANRDTLYRKIQASVDSLGADVSFHGEESYFFVLEDTSKGEIVGVSGIVASAGFNEPFYSYRNETIIHASPGLGIHNKIHALSLCHDLTGNTLLASFFILKPYQFTQYSDLLSRARFLFIANFPERFAESVVSEMVGVSDANGHSPFWDSVGRRFFGMDYQEAELYCGVKGRKFISELMPQHPIYVPLLSDAAQAAIGQVSPDSAVPFDVLLREGFETENYVDIFDGGPTVHARTQNIHSILQSRLVSAHRGHQRPGTPHLIANCRCEFRATVAELTLPRGDDITLDPKLADALEIADGDHVRIVPL